jgi:hypothetical protein
VLTVSTSCFARMSLQAPLPAGRRNMDRQEALSPRPPALTNKEGRGRSLAARSVQWRGFSFWVAIGLNARRCELA